MNNINDKFRTNLIAYYFVLPLNKKNAVLASILTEVLLNGSNKYKTIEEINNKKDSLYGVVVDFDISKNMNKLVFEAVLIYPKYGYIKKGLNLENEAIKFFDEILFNPLIVDGRFDDKIFENEKNNLILELESIKKDISVYSYKKLNECVYEESDLSIYKYGDIDTAKKISNLDLVDFYNNVLLNSKIYKYKNNEIIDKKEEKIECIKPNRKVFKSYSESIDSTQSILNFVYTIDTENDFRKKYAMSLLSIIVGGGTDSILFNEIREKHNLCYYIYTSYDRFKDVMVLNLGIELKNYELASNEIDKIMELIKDDMITEDMLKNAKVYFINSLKSVSDSQIRNINYTFVNNLYSQEDSIEERIKKINSIKKSEVIDVAKRLFKHTELFIKGEIDEVK